MIIEYDKKNDKIIYDFKNEFLKVEVSKKTVMLATNEIVTWDVIFTHKKTDDCKWDQFLVTFDRERKMTATLKKKENFLLSLEDKIEIIDLNKVPNFKKYLIALEKRSESIMEKNPLEHKTFNVEIYCNINELYELYNFHTYDEQTLKKGLR